MNPPRELAALLAVVLWLLVACTGEAARVTRLDLTVDGSVDPPGDRIDVGLVLDRGENQVTLQLRGSKCSPTIGPADM